MSFDSDARDDRRRAGARGARAAARELGVAAFGANHGRGPAAALDRARGDAGGGPPLAALPNVGPRDDRAARGSRSRTRRPSTSREFAARARALGARVIGGCCGTTPAQIAAIRAAIDENRAAPRRSAARERALERARRPTEEPTGARAAARAPASSWSRSSSTRRSAAARAGLIDAAPAIKESGLAQLVDVNDNPRARARMSGADARRCAIQRARRASRSSRT